MSQYLTIDGISFSDENILLDRLIRAFEREDRIVFLVGSPLTAQGKNEDERGVPSVSRFIELVREKISDKENSLKAFNDGMAALRVSSDQYQYAMRFLVNACGKKVLIELVRDATLTAYTADRKGSLDSEEALYRLEDNFDNWAFRPGVIALGRILAEHEWARRSPLLTTNFDPLIEISTRKAGGKAQTIRLPQDGKFDNIHGTDTANIVHLHGYWTGKETLHSIEQLTRPRPQLKGCLRTLLGKSTLIVICYGGWDDVFTKTLRELICESNDDLDVLWTFYCNNEDEILRDYKPLLEAFQHTLGQRIVLYKGVDCHVLLPRLASELAVLAIKKKCSINKADEQTPEDYIFEPGEVSKNTSEVPEKTDALVNLIDSPPSESSATEKLNHLIRWVPRIEYHHQTIRRDDQVLMRSALSMQRVAWLVADWGLGKDEFLSVVLSGTDATSYLRINLENIDLDEISKSPSEAIQKTVGVTLEQIDNIIPPEDHEFDVTKLEIILQSILDFCPSTCIVLTTRRVPLHSKYQIVRLKPLDELDCTEYILRHSQYTQELSTNNNTRYFIFSKSEGIPMHIDRLLKTLSVVSLGELMNNELERTFSDSTLHSEPVPRALQITLNGLLGATDKDTKRALNLLKVLSVLQYGETLITLKKFYPTEPIRSEHAEKLKSLDLIESRPLIQIQQTLLRQMTQAEVPKLLSVPRQVRDYVLKLMKNEEKLEISRAAINLYFGERWREGKPRFAHAVENLGTNPGAGNPHLILIYMIRDACERNDLDLCAKLVLLSIEYVSFLSRKDRFREVAIAASELIHILESNNLEHGLAWLYYLAGYGNRMIDEPTKAVDLMKSALVHSDSEESISKEWKAGVRVELALNFEKLDDKDASLEEAQAARELVERDTAYDLQAQCIIIQNQDKPRHQIRQELRLLETKAHRKKHVSLANNIALMIAYHTDDTDDRQDLYKQVITREQKTGYTFSRALVLKCSELIDLGRIREITTHDRKLLNEAYSYFYVQRLSFLFDTAHSVLWNLATQEASVPILLRLFRYGSFVWRIYNKPNKEKEALVALKPKLKSREHAGEENMELTYYRNRLLSISE